MLSYSDDEEEGMGLVGRQRSYSAPAIFHEEKDEDIREAALTPPPTTPGGSVEQQKKSGHQAINVLCRFRPENALEVANGGVSCVDFSADNKTVTMKTPDRVGSGTDSYQFFYTHVFQSFATQTDVHAFVGEPIVDNFFSGVNCSLLAYGQTGSGKTYTMMGVVDDRTGEVIEQQGLIPRLFTNIFRQAQEKEDIQEMALNICFVELYMEKLQDLLWRPDPATGGRSPARINPFGQFVDDDDKMEIQQKPDGTMFIKNCTTVDVFEMHQAMEVIQRGLRRRTTAATKSNKYSSRSHAVLILTLTTKEHSTKIIRNSQLYLVDLAGSEKVSKTEAEGMRLEEAKNINQSLFALGQVVTALSNKSSTKRRGYVHIPYRDSKLTRLLANSFGGNALTFMIVTCSPNSYNDTETLSTLRFGAKARMILTKPVKNQFRTVEELEFLLEKARQEIEMQRAEISVLKNQVRSVAATSKNVISSHAGKGARMMSSVLENRFSTILSAVGRCPISGEFMKDPVVVLDGFTYDRRHISAYLRREENNLVSPMTGKQVNATLMIPNLLVKSLYSLADEAGIPYHMDDDLVLRAPTSPFHVFDIMGVIMEFFALDQRLQYARVNTVFARAIYDRSLWVDAINKLVAKESPARQTVINSLQLPAHKVYLTLVRGEDAHSIGKALDRLQYSKATMTLYSSGLRR